MGEERKFKIREKEKEHHFPKHKVKHRKVRNFSVQYSIYEQ